jgi:hypothetical protein
MLFIMQKLVFLASLTSAPGALVSMTHIKIPSSDSAWFKLQLTKTSALYYSLERHEQFCDSIIVINQRNDTLRSMLDIIN